MTHASSDTVSAAQERFPSRAVSDEPPGADLFAVLFANFAGGLCGLGLWVLWPEP